MWVIKINFLGRIVRQNSFRDACASLPSGWAERFLNELGCICILTARGPLRLQVLATFRLFVSFELDLLRGGERKDDTRTAKVGLLRN
mgnify:CR=1 FL=1